MSEIRIIKKYPNRRLYDTTLSRYITLEEVKGLVEAGVFFKIIETRTQKDISHNTLLQIVLEQENNKTSFFNIQVLEQLIRLSAQLSSISHDATAFYESVAQTFSDTVHALAQSAALIQKKSSI